jgi:hypothetical protein
MSKFVQAVLVGLLVTFILDFFLFLGIFLNYINFYEIDLYYNILFADNQNWYLFFTLSLLIGSMIMYLKNYRVGLTLVGILFLLVSLTLIEPIGLDIGKKVFMSQKVTIKSGKYSYVGDLIYNGREFLYLYDYKYKKIMKLNKKELHE